MNFLASAILALIRILTRIDARLQGNEKATIDLTQKIIEMEAKMAMQLQDLDAAQAALDAKVDEAGTKVAGAVNDLKTEIQALKDQIATGVDVTAQVNKADAILAKVQAIIDGLPTPPAP